MKANLCAILLTLTACSSAESEPASKAPKSTETTPDDATDEPGAKDETTDEDDAGAPPADRVVSGTWERVVVSPEDAPIKPIYDIVVRDRDDVYVTEGASNLGTGFYHFTGTAWSSLRFSGYNTSLERLGSGDVVAYGDVLVKPAGDSWVEFSTPPDQRRVYSLAGNSLDSIFFSTTHGVYELANRRASLISSLRPDGTLQRTADGALAYLVSDRDGTDLFRLIDGTWTDAVVPDAYDDPKTGHGLFGSATDDLWFVSNSYTLVHYDGASFQSVPGPDDEWGCSLRGGFATSKKNAWLSGAEGCLFHWNGESWSKVDSGVDATIWTIHASSPENVWATFASETEVLRLIPSGK